MQLHDWDERGYSTCAQWVEEGLASGFPSALAVVDRALVVAAAILGDVFGESLAYGAFGLAAVVDTYGVAQALDAHSEVGALETLGVAEALGTPDVA